MTIFSRIFKRKPAPKRETVTVDDDGIVHTMPDASQETVRWVDLQSVTLVTTDAGPFATDLYWVLIGSASRCLIPGDAQGVDQLLERLQQLPGFDNMRFIMC